MELPYIIFEIQTDGEGSVATLPPVVKQTKNEAWSEFYLKCAYAATSTAVIHTVILVTADGQIVTTPKTFMHREVKPDEE